MRWRRFESILVAAERHHFPITNLDAVGDKMSRARSTTLAIILVPENVSWEALASLYGNLADDIRAWRRSSDSVQNSHSNQGDNSAMTEYASVYADPLRDAAFHSLDDETGTLRKALKIAR